MPSFPTGFPKMERKEKKPLNTVEIFEILALKTTVLCLYFLREKTQKVLYEWIITKQNSVTADSGHWQYFKKQK